MPGICAGGADAARRGHKARTGNAETASSRRRRWIGSRVTRMIPETGSPLQGEAAAGPLTLDRRLLHIIHSVAPSGGGTTEGVRRLGEVCAGSGMEVLCLDDPAAPYLRGFGLPVHALGPVRGRYGYTPRLKAWLGEHWTGFDGAVIHGLWQYHSYGAYAALRRRLPYAIFPHGMLDPYFRRAFPIKHLRKQAYWLAREHCVLRDALAVCFTSAAERDSAMTTMWPHRWRPVVVSFGAAAPPEEAADQRARFLQQFPQLAGRRFFLLLSRIHVKKGCDLAIEAWSRIAAAEPDLDLVIAGPDEDGLRPRLEKQARMLGLNHRLHWTGMIEGEVKWGAFRAAEAFVLPSHQENFGVAVVEALACRLPVLISDKVNIAPDILQDRAGLVAEDTAEGTYRSMLRWLAMPQEERRRMVENGSRAFVNRYAMGRTAQALNDLFRRPKAEELHARGGQGAAPPPGSNPGSNPGSSSGSSPG